jgi:hypothetical protein
MVNGNMTQSQTITYYLEPKEIGNFYILPASVNADGKVVETAPLEVLVVPNPDGIKQKPPRQTDRFQLNWSDPFEFDFSFPELSPLTQPTPPPPPQPQETPKKKRKTIRI